jgi:hypothetical protein
LCKVPPAEHLDSLSEPCLLFDVLGIAVARVARVDRVRHRGVSGRGVVPIREPFERDCARSCLRIELRFLRQVQHAPPLASVDDARVGRLEPREHAEERRLAAAVNAEQSHAIAFLDRHRRIGEERLWAIGLGQRSGAQKGHDGFG